MLIISLKSLHLQLKSFLTSSMYKLIIPLGCRLHFPSSLRPCFSATRCRRTWSHSAAIKKLGWTPRSSVMVERTEETPSKRLMTPSLAGCSRIISTSPLSLLVLGSVKTLSSQIRLSVTFGDVIENDHRQTVTAQEWRPGGASIGRACAGGASIGRVCTVSQCPNSRAIITSRMSSGMESVPFLRSQSSVLLALHLLDSVSASVPSARGQYLGEGGSRFSWRHKSCSKVSCNLKGVKSNTACGWTLVQKKSRANGSTLAIQSPFKSRRR